MTQREAFEAWWHSLICCNVLNATSLVANKHVLRVGSKTCQVGKRDILYAKTVLIATFAKNAVYYLYWMSRYPEDILGIAQPAARASKM